jgi:hypothetical protein
VIDDQSIKTYRVLIPPIKFDPEYHLLIPFRLVSHWVSLRDAEADALQNAIKALRKLADEANQLAQQRSPLAECEKEVSNAQKSLSDDLTQFFKNVELYREGVFSHTTKESIATLGIGAQLDALESEFTESDKAAFTADALRSLFPEFNEFSARALTRLTALDQRIRSVLGAIKELRISMPAVTQQSLTPAFELEKSGLLGTITLDVQKDVDELSRKLEVRLSAALVDARDRFQAAIGAAKKERRKRYIGIVVFGGLLSAALYFGYLYLNYQASQNLLSIIGWSLVTNLFGDGLGYLAARALDNFPQTSSTIRENCEIQFRGKIADLAEDEMKAHDFAALNEPNLAERLSQVYRRILANDPDGWHQRAGEHLAQLKDVYSDYHKAWVEYVEVVNEIGNRVSAYFSDATKNLELLNAVAGRIKERAIEPSFSLLDHTRQSLDDVKEQIQAVEFA